MNWMYIVEKQIKYLHGVPGLRFFLAGGRGRGGPEELGVAVGCVGWLLNSSPMRKKDEEDESAAMVNSCFGLCGKGN